MTDTENPKGSNWRSSVSLCLLTWCSIALLSFLVSWVVGGDEFKESIGGNYTLIALLGGIAVGAALKIIPWHGGDVPPRHESWI